MNQYAFQRLPGAESIEVKANSLNSLMKSLQLGKLIPTWKQRLKIDLHYYRGQAYCLVTPDSSIFNQKAKDPIILCWSVEMPIEITVGKEIYSSSILYGSNSGFDTTFQLNLESIVRELIGPKMRWEDLRVFLADGDEVTSLIDSKIFEGYYRILVKGTKEYSSIALSDLKGDFVWAAPIDVSSEEPQTTNEFAQCLTSHVFSAEEEALLDSKKHYLLPYLRDLQKIMRLETCYTEAFRRLIINPFLTAVASILEGQLSVEYFETKPIPQRKGSGPFDFVIDHVELLTSSALFPMDNEGFAQLLKDDFHAQNVKDMIDSMLEGKGEIVWEKGLGQLLAQMLDRAQLHSFKRKRADPPKRIKGILATGQQYLLFELRANYPETPSLHYYGKHSLNILPRLTGRKSGLNFQKEEGGKIQFETEVSELEVKNLLKTLLLFARF